LQGYLDRWEAETDHGGRKGPFDAHGLTDDIREHLRLSGADVAWLATHVSVDTVTITVKVSPLSAPATSTTYTVPDLHLEGANLLDAHLEGADLRSAHLEWATLSSAHLERANLGGADLRGVVLNFAHMESAYLRLAHLEGANLMGTSLERANLNEAHLEGASLKYADLQKANLNSANLSWADLFKTQLAGSELSEAHLEGSDLRGTSLDDQSLLNDTSLDSATRLGDIRWGGVGTVDLTRVNWGAIHRLGDETILDRSADLAGYELAMRAYRQVATQLRAQGMTEVADRFHYRAQVCQRRLLLRRFRIPQYLGSLLLDLISGHGFKPGRSFLTYLFVIFGFAAAFFAIGSGVLGIGGHEAINSPVSALVFSVTSFHGRGFFPGGGLALDDPITILAAIEAIMGLFIEITFIATFTQRFFAR
jgi:uncharacterized protein YjbI with pentapeptide repeats